MTEHRPLKEQHGLSSNREPAETAGPGGDGTRFGNYDLVRRIDVGGMGEVYLARQRTAFGREVAVKIMRSDLVNDLTARERFLREAEVSAHLKHEHILPLFEFGEVGGRLFLVTPYIEGGTLARRLHSGPLSLAEVHQLFSALVRAVSYIHKRGVIHRDLKPSNILLDVEEGSDQVYVRLIDFGIATIQGMTASPPLTVAGHELGTVAYMAPERLSGVAAPSNDIYSLGMILYQMLTGHLPTDRTLMDLPYPFEEIVRRSTMPNPADRYATADELLGAFERAYRSFTEPVGIDTSLSPDRSVGIDSSRPPDGSLTTNGLRPALTPSAPTSVKLRSVPLRRDIEDIMPAMPQAASQALQAAQMMQPPVHMPVPQPSVPSALLAQQHGFTREDYNAPTVALAPDVAPQPDVRQPAPAGSRSPVSQRSLPQVSLAPPQMPPLPVRPARKRSPLIFLSLLTVAVLMAGAGLGFLALQSIVSAGITVSPQVHTVTGVFTITAKPGLHTSDVGSASIPAAVLNTSKTSTQDGPTTGISCTFGFFDCRQVVDFGDVDAIVTQMRPGLRSQLSQELQSQARTNGATLVGPIRYADTNVTSNPPIGGRGKRVDVSLTEQASVEYIKMSDVQALAPLLLTQQVHRQYDASYTLLNPMTQMGQPVVQNVDDTGNVTIQIAAGGVAEYQLTPEQLSHIRDHLKGLKVSAAYSLLEHQPGIDPKSVTLHINYGDTMPKNVQQIKLTALGVNTASLPPVQLPVVKASPTPTQ